MGTPFLETPTGNSGISAFDDLDCSEWLYARCVNYGSFMVWIAQLWWLLSKKDTPLPLLHDMRKHMVQGGASLQSVHRLMVNVNHSSEEWHSWKRIPCYHYVRTAVSSRGHTKVKRGLSGRSCITKQTHRIHRWQVRPSWTKSYVEKLTHTRRGQVKGADTKIEESEDET